jgi:hypothetical protein
MNKNQLSKLHNFCFLTCILNDLSDLSLPFYLSLLYYLETDTFGTVLQSFWAIEVMIVTYTPRISMCYALMSSEQQMLLFN